MSSLSASRIPLFKIKVEEKELLIFENATHFDLYYKPEYVDPIVEKVSAFFNNYM